MRPFLPRPFAFFCAAFLLAVPLAGCQTAEETYEEVADLYEDDDYLAVEIEDTDASGTVTGVARFAYDAQEGEAYVQGRVTGLEPGLHGFHVHENGSCAMQDGTPAGAAGGHYNPDDTPHGAPDDDADERHVGDFGNIRANDEGVAEFSFSYVRDETDFDNLEDRAVLIHGGRDDLRSQPSGDAGARVGCGQMTDAENVYDGMLDDM
jgi:Cu-Zn family superoxide dismutase